MLRDRARTMDYAEGAAMLSPDAGTLAPGGPGAATDKSEDPPRQAGGKSMVAQYARAWETMRFLREKTIEIAAASGGKESFAPAFLKSFEGAVDKRDKDYEGDATRVLDLARSSVKFKSFKHLKAAQEVLESSVEVVRVKDRFEKPAMGYRDVTYNVMVNGHICEIQLHLEAILQAKAGKGHAIYEDWRKLKKLKDRTAEQNEEMERLKQQSIDFYDGVFATVQ